MTDSGEFIYEARVTCEVHAQTSGASAMREEAVLHRTLSWHGHATPGAQATDVPPNVCEEEEVVNKDEMKMDGGLVFWGVSGSPHLISSRYQIIQI